jgi:hypothetical protein
VVSFTLLPLYPQVKSPRYPLERTGWAPEPVWTLFLLRNLISPYLLLAFRLQPFRVYSSSVSFSSSIRFSLFAGIYFFQPQTAFGHITLLRLFSSTLLQGYNLRLRNWCPASGYRFSIAERTGAPIYCAQQKCQPQHHMRPLLGGLACPMDLARMSE